MPAAHLDTVVEQIRTLVATQGRTGWSDAQLLLAFANGRDQSAFATLVQRHGPMVLRVCRHVLHHLQDAEDAFQATFLTLARQATSIRKPEALGSWLHGVALRIARTARRTTERRRRHEEKAQATARQTPSNDLAWREVQAVLDEEIQRLPSKYRAVFVLCCLETRSRTEAAQQLGLKEGTVSSRLALARERLKHRLARRGISLTAVLGAAALTDQMTLAAVPTLLLTKTVQLACRYAWNPGTAAGLISAEVAALVQAATSSGLALQGKLLVGLLVLAGVLTAGTGAFLPWPPNHDQTEPPAATEPSPLPPANPLAARFPGPDLTAIERRLDKEPAYHGSPSYGLLVFGPRAATRVWLVIDGERLYIDRKGNGDLTDRDNQVEATSWPQAIWSRTASVFGQFLDEPIQRRLQQKRKREAQEGHGAWEPILPGRPAGAQTPVKIRRFRLGELIAGTTRYTNLAIRICEFEPGDRRMTLLIHLNDQQSQYSSPDLVPLARRSAEAPIIHLNGPLTMRLCQPEALQRGQRVLPLKAVLGTPGLGENAFAPLGLDQLPAGVFPTAVVAFPNPNPGGAPVEVQTALDQVNRTRPTQGFSGSVPVPETVGEGPVWVTLSFPGWKEGTVVPARVPLPVSATKPRSVARPKVSMVPNPR